MLAEIYGRFLEGPFAGYRFAWSRTLHGFEQRAHYARIASGRQTPTTARTPLAASDVFLHLRLESLEAVTPPRDILIADYAGEVFRGMANDVQAARSHPLLPRADHIAFLVDGESLSDLERRHEARYGLDMLMQSVLDAEVDRAVKSVIFTKWDAALKGDDADQLEEFVEALEEQIRRKHEPRSGELDFIKTAASPELGSPIAHGKNLDKVLRAWVGSVLQPIDVASPPELHVVREFDRFRSIGVGRVR